MLGSNDLNADGGAQAMQEERLCIAKLAVYLPAQLPENLSWSEWQRAGSTFWEIQAALYRAKDHQEATPPWDANEWDVIYPSSESDKLLQDYGYYGSSQEHNIRLPGGYTLTPLQQACVYNRVDTVKALVRSNLANSINAKEPITGKTALHFAALLGHHQCIAALLQSDNIDVNVQDACQATPLLDACRATGAAGTRGLQRLLAHDEVKLNATQADGKNVLWIAAEHGDQEKIEHLQRFTVDPRHHCRWYQWFTLPSDLARQHYDYCDRELQQDMNESDECNALRGLYQQKFQAYQAIQPILKRQERERLLKWSVPIRIILTLGVLLTGLGVVGGVSLILTQKGILANVLPYLLPMTVTLFVCAFLIFAGCLQLFRRRHSQKDNKIQYERQQLLDRANTQDYSEGNNHALEGQLISSSLTVTKHDTNQPALYVNQAVADFKTLCEQQREVLRSCWLTPTAEINIKARDAKIKQAYDTVRKAYRRLAGQCHPDQAKGQSDELMQIVNDVYQPWREHVSKDYNGHWYIAPAFFPAKPLGTWSTHLSSQADDAYWKKRFAEIDRNLERRQAEDDAMARQAEEDRRVQQKTWERAQRASKRLERIKTKIEQDRQALQSSTKQQQQYRHQQQINHQAEARKTQMQELDTNSAALSEKVSKTLEGTDEILSDLYAAIESADRTLEENRNARSQSKTSVVLEHNTDLKPEALATTTSAANNRSSPPSQDKEKTQDRINSQHAAPLTFVRDFHNSKRHDGNCGESFLLNKQDQHARKNSSSP